MAPRLSLSLSCIRYSTYCFFLPSFFLLRFSLMFTFIDRSPPLLFLLRSASAQALQALLPGFFFPLQFLLLSFLLIFSFVIRLRHS